MDLKAPVILGIVVGLSIYFIFLAREQIDLATEAVTQLNSCENSAIKNCAGAPEYFRLTSSWDSNVKIYWLLSLLFSLACGYFAPKFKK